MTVVYRVLGAHLLLFVALGTAIAEPSSIVGGSLFFQNRGLLTPSGRVQPIISASLNSPSIISTQPNLGFFAPLPAKPSTPEPHTARAIPVAPNTPTHVMTASMRAPYRLPQGSAAVEHIRHIIGQAESRRDGYNAVQHGAKIRPQKPPTQMTLREIFAWIKATPGQPHAIGRYQFIPTTLKRVVSEVGIDHGALFTPAVQDALADVLLRDAGLQAFEAGTMKRRDFMNNLAKIWAGLPNSTGKSHYHGYAGNKASITWKEFEMHIAKAQIAQS